MLAFSGFRKTCVFKKAQPTGFWFFLGGLGFIGFFGFFYLNEQLGNLSVALAHQLSFYLDLYFRDYLKICKFITC